MTMQNYSYNIKKTHKKMSHQTSNVSYHNVSISNSKPNSAIKRVSSTLLGRWHLLMGLTALGAASMSTMSIAATPVEFVHQDWQVVCDNTRTCRLAGYQAENNSDFPASVLLIRRAGSNAPVIGKVKLGGAKEGSAKALMQLGNRHRLSLWINGKDLGETKPFSSASGDADLTQAQVTALIEALTKSSKIEFVVRNSRWELSDKGATAVMLKADEAQGRVGTPSAFIRANGTNKPNSAVLAPKPAPRLSMVIPNPNANAKKFGIRRSQLASMMASTMKNSADECPNLMDESPWRLKRLSDSKLLVQHNCWTGAYNIGDGMWVINDSQPYNPTLVTTDATNYNNGKISAVQKGRGIGDCLSQSDWVWTGSSFVKSQVSTTGLCRMIEAGGAWQMPSYVTEVKISR